MTDMRRTLLWVVFSMSLFLIYDAWNKHNGQPSFFSPVPAKGATPPAPAGLPKSAVTTGSTLGATLGAAPVATPGAPFVVAEQTTITTDLVKATLSSVGGTLTRLQLLQYPDHVAQEWYEPVLELFGRKAAPAAPKDVLLLDEAPDRLYVAESGLIPTMGGSGLPNHHTAMTLVPGDRTLTAGQSTLQVKFESPVVGGQLDLDRSQGGGGGGNGGGGGGEALLKLRK